MIFWSFTLSSGWGLRVLHAHLHVWGDFIFLWVLRLLFGWLTFKPWCSFLSGSFSLFTSRFLLIVPFFSLRSLMHTQEAQSCCTALIVLDSPPTHISEHTGECRLTCSGFLDLILDDAYSAKLWLTASWFFPWGRLSKLQDLEITVAEPWSGMDDDDLNANEN